MRNRIDVGEWLKACVCLVVLFCLFGCVNPRWGAGIGGLWTAHETSEHQFSRGGEGNSITTDADDGWGLMGKFDVVGNLKSEKPALQKVLIGARLNISHNEVDNADVESYWHPHSVHHGHSHSKRAAPSPIFVKSTVEVGYQIVSLAPVVGYDFDFIRPYVTGGPALVFLEAVGDYYGAKSESDTTLGYHAAVGAEVPIDDNVYFFAEGRWQWAEPSLYYLESSKFNFDLNTWGTAAGFGVRF